MATVGKTADRIPPRKQQQIWVNEKDRRKGRVRNNIEEKEEKREEDKIGKETRALQVPCGSETYGYSGKNKSQNAYGNYSTYRSMNTDIEEKEGKGTL